MIEYKVYITRPTEDEELLEASKWARKLGRTIIEGLGDGASETVDKVYDSIPENHIMDVVEIISEEELTEADAKDIIPINDITVFTLKKKEN